MWEGRGDTQVEEGMGPNEVVLDVGAAAVKKGHTRSKKETKQLLYLLHFGNTIVVGRFD